MAGPGAGQQPERGGTAWGVDEWRGCKVGWSAVANRVSRWGSHRLRRPPGRRAGCWSVSGFGGGGVSGGQGRRVFTEGAWRGGVRTEPRPSGSGRSKGPRGLLPYGRGSVRGNAEVLCGAGGAAGASRIRASSREPSARRRVYGGSGSVRLGFISTRFVEAGSWCDDQGRSDW